MPFVRLSKPVPKASLVCFSHLRWDFVWQRPQHLLSRAAKHYDVLVIEEPIFKAGRDSHMDVGDRPQGVTIAVPMLPGRTCRHEDVILEQRDLIEDLIGREADEPARVLVLQPMAIAFTSDLEGDLCIYDSMDELSLFRGASRELLAWKMRSSPALRSRVHRRHEPL